MNSSKPRTAGRPRSDASRAALVDSAYWQVMDLGYGVATAEAIAKSAGAGKQTLYRWWPSKGRLVLEAITGKLRERIDRPREAAQKAGDVEKFLIADVTSLRPFADALRGLVCDAASDPDLAEALRTDFFEPREEALRSALANARVDEGFVFALVESIEGAILRRVMFGEALDDQYGRRLAVVARTG